MFIFISISFKIWKTIGETYYNVTLFKELEVSFKINCKRYSTINKKVKNAF